MTPSPPSPQHQTWREACSAAAARIEEFREDLRHALDEATGLLNADPQTPSDMWFEVSKRLKHACWRLGSATYCLGEWAEPDDARADIDTHQERGRRNTRQWDSH